MHPMSETAAAPWRTDTPYTRFIVLSDARTGSNLLVEALNAHPEIVCFRELFNLEAEIDYNVAGYDGSAPDDIALRRSDAARFITQRVFTEQPDAVRAVGFKFHYLHAFGYGGIAEAMAADSGLRIVHLVRRNKLRTLVSKKIAEETGAWMQHDAGAQRRDLLRRTLSGGEIGRLARQPSRLAERIRQIARPPRATPAAGRAAVTLTHAECEQFFWAEALQAEDYERRLFAGHPQMMTTYEELVAERERVLGEVCAFIGVTPAAVSAPTLRRQNPEPLRALIANYDELRASYADHPVVAAWFEE
jgi:LPS sulfotransferase NodH